MTVYVVVSYSGEYSSYGESIEGVYTTLDRAKEVGRATLSAYRAVTDWELKQTPSWNAYEMTPKNRSYASSGCYIHVMELDQSPVPA